MFQKKSILRLLFFLIAFGNQETILAQVLRIEIASKPLKHPEDTLFIAGSFNNWQPSLLPYRFLKSEKGVEYIELKGLQSGIIEFKITRGNWSKTESNSKGQSINNRVFHVKSDTLIHIDVEGWIDDFPSRPPVTTKSKQVFFMDTAFYMPQLQRTRRIWVYLPEEYFSTKKRFPVMYMHDGQNLFDARTAAFGEWGVDEMMDSLRTSHQCIIVGIDHGERFRLIEYNPFDSRFGKGEGDAYVDFIVQTLKPYIDSLYKTRPGRESTFISGSSMGGLISFYAVLKYPMVFGGAGIFSPSFWIAPSLINEIEKRKSAVQPALYFVCGEQESNTMVADVKKIYNELQRNQYKKLFLKIVPQGRHQEQFWQQEMYECYRWLYRYIK
jgi:metallo-beta-lactamase class B